MRPKGRGSFLLQALQVLLSRPQRCPPVSGWHWHPSWSCISLDPSLRGDPSLQVNDSPSRLNHLESFENQRLRTNPPQIESDYWE